MKKCLFFFLVMLFWENTSVFSQSRKIISQYQQVRGYFNPALSGYEGSQILSLVRNQWSGINNNPKSYILGGSLDFSDLSGKGISEQEGKNAIGFSILNDTHGAFRENQFVFNYASRIRISEKANVRLGAGLFFQEVRLDGNQLTFEQQTDPKIGEFLGRISDQQFFDINMGLALTHESYYFGYSVHRVNSGRISKGDNFIDLFPTEHLLQAGFNQDLNPDLNISTDMLFRSWNSGRDILDMNLLVTFKKIVSVGFGHRFDYASNLHFGLRLKKISLGYVYELPTTTGYLLPGNIQEFMLSYKLFENK